MRISVDRVISRLNEIYECGEQKSGIHSRVAYSPEDKKGREVFKNCLREAGMRIRQDEAGNLIARLEGEENLPSILVGSHLDTVIDGGKYDGALGCVAGLEVAETLVKSGFKLRHPLEIIIFADEEGIRFGNGMFGSSAFCGKDLNDFAWDDKDSDGKLRKDVLREFGVELEKAAQAVRSQDTVSCMLELHVEQGGILEENKMSLGIVTSIAGVKRYEVVVRGEANHSGSTQMCHRKDALAAASKFISQLPELVKKYGDEFTVATVGCIDAEPGAVNVIPGKCSFQLEIRDQKESVMLTMETVCRELLINITKDKDMSFTMEQVSSHRPGTMDEKIQDAFRSVCGDKHLAYQNLPSGAFHDSLLLTEKFPTGMLFIPSINGISHSPLENSRREDIEKGCQVLLETILKLDKKEG